MTLRIEPLESCMNVLNVFSLKCFILSIYILCCPFTILSRGLTIIKIFCAYSVVDTEYWSVSTN